MMTNVMEAIMMICFGFSWPINFRKAYLAGNTRGTSISFLCLVEFGYLCGIAAKLMSGNVTYVLFFYILNLISVGANIVLYFVNRRKEHNLI